MIKIQMNNEERKILSKRIEPTFNSLLLFVIAEIALVLVLNIFSLISDDVVFRKYKVQWILPISIIILFFMFRKLITSKLRKDLRNNEKIILESYVCEKFQEKRGLYQYTDMNPDLNFLYYIAFNGYTVQIGKEQYNEMKRGDRIIAHIAPKSKYVLKVEIMNC